MAYSTLHKRWNGPVVYSTLQKRWKGTAVCSTLLKRGVICSDGLLHSPQPPQQMDYSGVWIFWWFTPHKNRIHSKWKIPGVYSSLHCWWNMYSCGLLHTWDNALDATLKLGKYPLVYSKAGQIFGSLPPSLGDISVANFGAGVIFRFLIPSLSQKIEEIG